MHDAIVAVKTCSVHDGDLPSRASKMIESYWSVHHTKGPMEIPMKDVSQFSSRLGTSFAFDYIRRWKRDIEASRSSVTNVNGKRQAAGTPSKFYRTIRFLHQGSDLHANIRSRINRPGHDPARKCPTYRLGRFHGRLRLELHAGLLQPGLGPTSFFCVFVFYLLDTFLCFEDFCFIFFGYTLLPLIRGGRSVCFTLQNRRNCWLIRWQAGGRCWLADRTFASHTFSLCLHAALEQAAICKTMPHEEYGARIGHDRPAARPVFVLWRGVLDLRPQSGLAAYGGICSDRSFYALWYASPYFGKQVCFPETEAGLCCPPGGGCLFSGSSHGKTSSRLPDG